MYTVECPSVGVFCYNTGMSFSDPKRNIEQFGLDEGMEVADFGAGAGYLAVEAAEAVGTDGAVYVIDVQKELLTKATHLAEDHHLHTITFIHGNLEAEHGSTLPDESVDAVVISNVLFQVENKNAVFLEAHRILRSGGKLLVIDWRESFDGLGPQAEHVLREEDVRIIAKNCSFTHMKDIDAGVYHYGLIYKK